MQCSNPDWILVEKSGVTEDIKVKWLVQLVVSYTMIKKKESEVTQSCLTLCDPMDCS